MQTIATACLTLLIIETGVIIFLIRQAYLKKAKSLRRLEYGRAAELPARQILEEAGYKIIYEQKKRASWFLMNTKPHTYSVRPDFIVEDGQHKRYVAEVKTGQSAELTCSDTRRQLLEYALLFGGSCQLLVNADSRKITKISFPELALYKNPKPQLPKITE